jgi:hypothetical protein
MRSATLAMLLALVALPAVAQERPQIYPTRDVAVTYRFTGNVPQGTPSGMTIAWLAAAQTMRMDLPGTGFMVADHRGQRAFMVMEEMRMIMDLPFAQAMQQHGPSANATYRREGTDTVAGTQCTVWFYQDRDTTGRSCITADGVMLRAQGSSGGQSGGMEATRVAYGAQDAGRFQRPQGYQSMQVPGGAAGAQPGGRSGK